ncbi:TldD/PmbA family protein [Oceanithermus desulfurans]|uniref:Peptidase U62 n=2 Tax=Oceanithermus desulfurans TaxID=227924 RepID=A0A511RGV4_9DEIN|nr:metallopeptidase TldD-related protein [Oceanithermus desulfurans]MBB6028824.1 PmbA protein [Oceanithermus desulfurans]GEM88883.1 peptidase U62 [Oceanithermus desulfurans NBRC 100063]
MTLQEAQTYLLRRARERGVELEALATGSRELTLRARGGDLEEITEAESAGIGVRVVTGGKTGYAYTEELTPEALDWMLAEAVENAELQADTDGFLPQGRSLGRHDLLGEGLSAPVDEKKQVALALEREVQKDPRVRQVGAATYAEREHQTELASTRGAAGGFRSGYAYQMVNAVMGEGASVKQGYELKVSREVAALDPASTAQDFLYKTGRLLGARPLASGRYTAYLEPKAFLALLAPFVSMWSAKQVIEGKSRLADKLGQQVASAVFTLYDDPDHPEGLANAPFDAEGTPTRRVYLLREGVVESFLHNSQTARKLGHEPTGHASRSYKGVLGVAPHNLIVAPGAGVRLEEGVLVTDLMGVHAGANPISGDFSLQALGLKVEGGEAAYPVENFTISGNVFELLERIVAVGQDLEWSVIFLVGASPMVEVADLAFAGA